MKEMYKAMPNSPITYLAQDITDDTGIIPVLNDTSLPIGPSLATIGSGLNSETIRYESKVSGELRGVTRGVEGNRRAWSKGTEIARYHTAYDHNTIVDNINEHVNGPFHILESGSDSNGYYVKFSDGTMICTREYNHDCTSTTNIGHVRYPKPFISPPACSMSLRGTNVHKDVIDFSKLAINGFDEQWGVRIGSTGSNSSLPLTLMAIGRWR